MSGTEGLAGMYPCPHTCRAACNWLLGTAPSPLEVVLRELLSSAVHYKEDPRPGSGGTGHMSRVSVAAQDTLGQEHRV